MAMGRSGIQYVETRKASSSNAPKKREGTIPIIGKAQDDFYYRIDGQEYASEAEASEHLLKPLLEFIY